MTISETCHSWELHSENLLSRQCIIDHVQSVDLDAISHFPDLSNNLSRLLLSANHPLMAKIPDANTRERILQRLQSISMLVCSFHCVKVSRGFFNRNQTVCLSKFYDKMFYIMQIISLHSSYTWLAHYRGFCYAIVISDGRGNKVCQHATTRRTFVDEIYRQEYCPCAVLYRSIISCRAYPCHICWINVARGSRLAARVRKIVQLVEKIMYDCSLLPIPTRGKTLWRRSCPLHLFSCLLQQ